MIHENGLNLGRIKGAASMDHPGDLGAWGEEGVNRVLVIVREELKRIMQFAGTTSLGAINRSYLEPRHSTGTQ